MYVCFSDPEPTCAVVTSPPIRGENVNLSCSMTYINYGDNARQNPGAVMTASIGWESAAGTVLSTTTTANSNSRGVKIGETLKTDVQTLASGAEIPSYNCTTDFQFTDGTTGGFTYALNSLSWTCVSPPVLTWCKYSINTRVRQAY